MTEELIKFTPGQRPEHIGPDELVRARPTGDNDWSNARPAIAWAWIEGWEFKRANPLPDDQLEAQCKARGWTVTKPLVTQAERDRLADAMIAGGFAGERDFRRGDCDKDVRAFIDTYEGTKP